MMDMIRSALTTTNDVNEYPELPPQEVTVEGTIGQNSAGSNRCALEGDPANYKQQKLLECTRLLRKCRLVIDDAHPENALRDYVQQNMQREPIRLPPLMQAPTIPEGMLAL